MKNKNCFTLVKLLVAIAISLPVLNKARAKAKQASCMSNLKQWEADNYDGWYPDDLSILANHSWSTFLRQATFDLMFEYGIDCSACCCPSYAVENTDHPLLECGLIIEQQ